MRTWGAILAALTSFPVSAQSGGDLPALQKDALKDSGARSAGIHALFDLSSVRGAPFPSDVFTVADPTNRTGRRVNMPLPDWCPPPPKHTERPSDCDDINVIDQLDGFNIMPRISIPFDGAIDPATVSSSSVFVVELAQQGDQTTIANVSGINQAVWDPDTHTLYVESDEALRQTAHYGVVVTNGILDASGRPVVASDDFESFRHDLNYGQTDSEDMKAYRKALIGALAAVERWGVAKKDVVALGIFTTQSATATLENIRDSMKASAPPAPANFAIGPGGSRAVFSVASIGKIESKQHTKVNPDGFAPPANVPLASLDFVPGAVGTVAWGTFASPQFIDGAAVMNPAGTREVPAGFGDKDLAFVVFLPSSPRPASGYPVVFLGHGGTSSIHTDAVWNFASKLAATGFASIAVNAVGRGAGAKSYLLITLHSGAQVQVSTPGRAIDVPDLLHPNGDGTIANAEGAIAQAPNIIVGQRDAVRQTAIDYMQLVRVIEAGMDVDGDGTADLDPSRMAFLGNSFAVGYELLFMAIEPDVPVAAVGSPGGLPGRADLLSMRPSGRTTVGTELGAHDPSLLNSAYGLPRYGGLPVTAPFYNENIPLRDRPIVINDVPGAIAIQEYFEHIEWVQNSEDAAAYAPHLHFDPLPGVPEKSMLILFAKGDQTAPNPRTSYIVRSGFFHDKTIFYRNDLAFAQEPTLVPKDPHTFLQRWTSPGITGVVARGGQQTVAAFLASGGNVIEQPEPTAYFEFPIQTLPEDFSYIP